MSQPLIQITTMREAFFQAFHAQKRRAPRAMTDMVFRQLKSRAGRIYHRKGWFVTRPS